MTSPSPEERAEKLVSEGMQEIEWDEHYGRKTFIADIAAAIREAVEAEREACAALCERHHHSRDTEYAMAASNIANAIRSRSEKP